MSKKHNKRVIKADVTVLLYKFLSTECHCTAHEIEMLLAVLQSLIPMEDVEHVRAIFEGKVTTTTKETPRFAVDMGHGDIRKFQLNMQHPQMLLLEYLEKKYGRRFGTLYWLAFGTTSKDLYTTLHKVRHAPAFRHLFASAESEVEA